MEPKYKTGDRVIVVHRMKGNGYHSYVLNGSVGTVDGVKLKLGGDGYIYHLDYDDIVIAHPDEFPRSIPEESWFRECCLDPAPSADSIVLEDFESVLG